MKNETNQSFYNPIPSTSLASFVTIVFWSNSSTRNYENDQAGC